jgi:hypothetical protein
MCGSDVDDASPVRMPSRPGDSACLAYSTPAAWLRATDPAGVHVAQSRRPGRAGLRDRQSSLRITPMSLPWIRTDG